MVVLEKTAKRESSLGSKQKFLYFTIPSSFTPMLTDMDLSNDMASFKAGLPDKSGTNLFLQREICLLPLRADHLNVEGWDRKAWVI